MPTWLDKILNSQSVQFALAALAFLIALWLVIVIARMLMGGRLRLPGGRSRQPRLGIVDAFDLDRQRQLIIVRRDNTEHLIMIGGPNDLLIESEIVRVEAREFREGRRDKSMEPMLDTRVPGDGRIPAPVGMPVGLGAPADAPPGNGGRLEEPLLPMALPQAPLPQAPLQPAPLPFGGERVQPGERMPPLDEPGIEPTAPLAAPLPRAPTFPLPPRRPTATPVAPERRPPSEPRPVRTPQPSPASPPIAAGAPDLPLPADGNPDMPVTEAGPLPPPSPAAVDPSPAVGPADLAARPVRPSPYLKPLPPRPPIRPLRRVTPQIEPSASPPAHPPEAPAPQPPAPTQAAVPGTPNPTVPTVESVPAPRPESQRPESQRLEPQPEPASDDKDALESLEEEMAKLLGRGG